MVFFSLGGEDTIRRERKLSEVLVQLDLPFSSLSLNLYSLYHPLSGLEPSTAGESSATWELRDPTRPPLAKSLEPLSNVASLPTQPFLIQLPDVSRTTQSASSQ